MADAVAVGEHGCIPEAQDLKAGAFQAPGAAGVVGGLVGVMAAVEFDDETRVPAEEIKDVGAEGDLALPYPAAELASAQDIPEAGLGLSVAATQGLGAALQGFLAEVLDPAHGEDVRYLFQGVKFLSPREAERERLGEGRLGLRLAVGRGFAAWPRVMAGGTADHRCTHRPSP